MADGDHGLVPWEEVDRLDFPATDTLHPAFDKRDSAPLHCKLSWLGRALHRSARSSRYVLDPDEEFSFVRDDTEESVVVVLVHDIDILLDHDLLLGVVV